MSKLSGTAEEQIIKEISRRVRSCRIYANMTQEELADKSMVSVGTIKRLEGGADISLGNLIKILKVFGMENNALLIIPDQSKRPSFYLEQENERKRVRKGKTVSSEWKWGEDL